MKANELMIGDWVLLWNKPQKVNYINLDDGERIGTDKQYLAQIVEAFEPISLTPEILEKNGFHTQKCNDLATEYSFATDLDNIPQTVIQYNIYSKEIEGVKSLCKIWTKSKYGRGQDDCHICGLMYVHKLQHALRLCGLSELAENFKV